MFNPLAAYFLAKYFIKSEKSTALASLPDQLTNFTFTLLGTLLKANELKLQAAK